MKKIDKKNISEEELKNVSAGGGCGPIGHVGIDPIYAPHGNLITSSMNYCAGYEHNPKETDHQECGSCMHFDYRCAGFGQCEKRTRGNDPYA